MTTETVHRPDELTTAVSLMAKIGACWSPSFSPDGEHVAFISNLSGTPQVWTVPRDGGWPIRITATDDPISAVSWSPNGTYLAFSLAPGGGMNSQVYLVRPDGTDVRRLTEGGQVNNWLGRWSHDGKTLAIASNRRDPNTMDIYLADIDSTALHPAIENRGTGTLTDLSRDGRWALVTRVAHRSDSNSYLVDLHSHSETLLTPHEGQGSVGDGLFSPDARTVYLQSDVDRDRAAFTGVHLSPQGALESVEVLASREDAELQEFELSDDGRLAALLWNVAGRNELTFFQCDTGEERPGPALPHEVVSSLTFSADGRYLAFAASGAAAPRDIWVLEVASGALGQVTHSPHPGIALDRLVIPDLVRFPAQDGLELTGWLYRPQGSTAPGPIVLSFHGGPEGQERPLFNSTYQALLQAGIAVLAPNVRGSSGFGKRFVNLDNGPLRFDAIRDIRACVEYVVGAGIAAAGRIGIMGGSYGGYMTMAGLTEFPDLFAAGANLFGIVNFDTFFRHTEPWMAAISTIKYGDPVTQADLLRDLSPIHKIDRVTAPTLVLHGANDTNVPVIEAEQTVASLRERQIPVELVLFPDEGHGFLKEPNRIRSTTSLVRWFTQYL